MSLPASLCDNPNHRREYESCDPLPSVTCDEPTKLSQHTCAVLECARSTIELSVRWFVTISPGTRFDRYGIFAPLGVGGRCEVYLAQDAKLDRKVALKILPAQVTT